MAESNNDSADNQQQFCLRWNNFQANIKSQFETIRDEEDFVDVTFACGGRLLGAHKIVLSACSPYFKRLFKNNPCPHPVIFMRDVEVRQVRALLEFMYSGEVNIAQTELPIFLKTAEALQIRGLTEASNNDLLRGNKQNETLNQTCETDKTIYIKRVQMANDDDVANKRICIAEDIHIKHENVLDFEIEDSTSEEMLQISDREKDTVILIDDSDFVEPKVELPSYDSDNCSNNADEKNFDFETISSGVNSSSVFKHATQQSAQDKRLLRPSTRSDAYKPSVSPSSSVSSSDLANNISSNSTRQTFRSNRSQISMTTSKLKSNPESQTSNNNHGNGGGHVDVNHINEYSNDSTSESNQIPNTSVNNNINANPEINRSMNARFTRQTTLHSLERRPCPICGRVYSNHSNLRQHINLIHSPEAMTCPLCKKQFRTKLYLRRHMASYHNEVNNSSIINNSNHGNNSGSEVKDFTVNNRPLNQNGGLVPQNDGFGQNSENSSVGMIVQNGAGYSI